MEVYKKALPPLQRKLEKACNKQKHVKTSKTIIMKLITLAAIICLLSNCSDSKKDAIRSFIDGTYVMSYANEYSQGRDTLRIAALSKEGNNYSITRSVTYQRIRNGKKLPKERKQEQWLCIYKEGDKVLYEVRKGKVISFVPEKDMLLVGTTQYQKTVDDYIRNFKLFK